MHVRFVVQALAVFIVALAVTTPLLANEVRPLSVQLSNDGTLLIVADPAKDAMAVYRIQGDTVALLATRDLSKDMAGDSAKAPAPTPPTKDVPGEDPPDFRRLANSVRVSASYSFSGAKETWDVGYLVPGTLEGIYEKIRSQVKDWRISSERITPFATAELQLVRDLMDLSISVQTQWEGWFLVRVQETQKKS